VPSLPTTQRYYSRDSIHLTSDIKRLRAKQTENISLNLKQLTYR
jgi:hypothetical protein